MTFYIKNREGEFEEIDDVKVFKERHDRWERSEGENVRKNAEKAIREELAESVRTEVEEKVKQDYQSKLDDAAKSVQTLETSLRRKTIAAEYGFKPETEKYLGDGSEDDMRKEADTLKNSFAVASQPPDKFTSDTVSATQQKTGIKVEI